MLLTVLTAALAACGEGGGSGGAGTAEPGVWTQLMPTGTAPSARWGHSAVLDPVRNGILIFGGTDIADGAVVNPANDLWLLGLEGTPTWTPVATTGTPPEPRQGHSAVLDLPNQRMIVFGGRRPLGNGAQTLFNDVWSLNLAVAPPAWTPLAPVGGPPAVRFGHSCVLDEPNQRMIVFAGASNLGAPAYDDVWTLSLTGTPTWTPVAVSGGPPSIRYLASTMFDAAAQTMTVVGGFTNSGLSNDLWTLALGPVLSTWSQPPVAGTPPTPRYGAYTVFDPVSHRLVLYGGATAPGGPTVDEVWHLDRVGGLSWSSPAPVTTPPSGRYVAPATYDGAAHRLILFGGTRAPFDPSATLAEVWALGL